MNNKYLLTQQINKYNDFKKNITQIGANLDSCANHLKVCINKLNDSYKGYGDNTEMIKLETNIQLTKNQISNVYIPQVELKLKSLLEQLNQL